MAAPYYLSNEKNSSLQQKLDNLTLLICQLAVDKLQAMEACGICAMVGHPTNMCPIRREDSYERMNVACGFPGQPQGRYDPYSYTNNSRWNDHNDFGYGNSQVNQLVHQNFPSYQHYMQPYPQQQQGQSSNSSMSLEEIVKSLATNIVQAQQETNARIQSLEMQIGQMATVIAQLEVQSAEELPSHTVVDQEENESEIVLESGNEVETPKETVPTSPKQDEADNITTDMDNVNEDKEVLCDDDIPTVAEVVEETNKDNLEDASTNNLEVEREEIELKQDLKEAETALYSLPLTLDKNAEFFIPLPVTDNKSLSSILQIPIPDLKFKHLYQPRGRCTLPMKNNMMDGVRKIHEIGVT